MFHFSGTELCNVKFGDILKDIIRTRNLSLKTISGATGVPISTLSEWTAGRAPKLNEAIIKLAQYLNLSLDELLTGNETRSDGSLSELQFCHHFTIDGRDYCIKLEKITKK